MITKTAFQTFGFIGLGLIGGSIARAIREKLPLLHLKLQVPLMKPLRNATASSYAHRFPIMPVI